MESAPIFDAALFIGKHHYAECFCADIEAGLIILLVGDVDKVIIYAQMLLSCGKLDF